MDSWIFPSRKCPLIDGHFYELVEISTYMDKKKGHENCIQFTLIRKTMLFYTSSKCNYYDNILS